MGYLHNGFNRSFGASVQLATVESCAIRNRYNHHLYTQTQEGNTTVLAQTAVPNGSYPTSTLFPPQEVGQIAMRAYGNGLLSGDIQADVTMILNASGNGSLTAEMGQVISMICSMIGDGTLDANLVGDYSGQIDMTGNGGMTTDIYGIANMMIDLLGNGDLETVIAGYGHMTIDMVVTGTGLSTANVGAAVWAELQTNINNAGTAGAALLAAGSAGDPWSTMLPASYPVGSAGYMLGVDTPTQLASIENIADLISIITRNKVTKSGDVITVYEHDGTTVHSQYNLAGGGRLPI